jgi:hypothetical protein
MQGKRPVAKLRSAGERADAHRRGAAAVRETACGDTTAGKESIAKECMRNEMEMEMDFGRQPIRRTNWASQLTISILAAPSGSLVNGNLTAKKHGLEGFTCEDLPSAFDSDDEAAD